MDVQPTAAASLERIAIALEALPERIDKIIENLSMVADELDGIHLEAENLPHAIDDLETQLIAIKEKLHG